MLSQCLYANTKPKTLAGEWDQDSDYFQSKGLINQLAEIDLFEDYELYVTDGHLAATRIVGKEPDEKRVYWDSPLSFSTDPAGIHHVAFNSHEGEPISATVSFEGKHLVLKIGNDEWAFSGTVQPTSESKGMFPSRNAPEQALLPRAGTGLKVRRTISTGSRSGRQRTASVVGPTLLRRSRGRATPVPRRGIAGGRRLRRSSLQ